VAGYLVLYGAGAAALVLVSRRFAAARPKVWTSLVLGAAALALLVAAVNPEAIRSKLQWVFGGVPAAAALAVVVLVYRHVVKRRRLDAREQTLLATVTVLAVVAAKTYSGFFFLAERAQPAVYAAPFVFVALSRLHLVELGRTRTALVAGTAWLGVLALICAGLTVKDARAQSAAVSGRGGTVHVTPAEAPLYRAAVGAIESGTAPGEAMLVAPQLSGLYTLTGRTDPLREISLVPGALAKPADERAAIRALARVRFAITDRHSFGEYGQTRFGASFDRLLATWLRRNFDHAATLRPRGDVDHTLDVWVRRAP
jgi:hypothetical protein